MGLSRPPGLSHSFADSFQSSQHVRLEHAHKCYAPGPVPLAQHWHTVGARGRAATSVCSRSQSARPQAGFLSLRLGDRPSLWDTRRGQSRASTEDMPSSGSFMSRGRRRSETREAALSLEGPSHHTPVPWGPYYMRRTRIPALEWQETEKEQIDTGQISAR